MIRTIDQPIYQDMRKNDIVEMLELLFPPANVSEKKNILNDLKSFNALNFEFALPEIQKILTSNEAADIFQDIKKQLVI